ERKIRIEWIEYTLNKPEKVQVDKNDPDIKHNFARISEFDNRVLKVVYNYKSSPVKIITVYFDRKKKGDL
ncbi:MAG: DUF4258 domain-containing protein, partial [Oligoflexia bacterium]|nr:DUF4258 domain-containing protein [Oligoflexia bacterium]